MSDRRMFQSDRALAQTYAELSRRSAQLSRRSTWPAAIQSAIVQQNLTNYPGPVGDTEDPDWPSNAVGDPASFIVLPEGRWVCTLQATQSLTFSDCYSGWLGIRSGVGGTPQRDLFSEVPAPTTFGRTMRTALSVNSDGTTRVELYPFFGYLDAGAGFSMTQTLLSTSIIAYPG